MITSSQQKEEVGKVLMLIRRYASDLEELEGNSKWTAGKIIFRSEGDEKGYYIYMVGPISNDKITFHMMPLYVKSEYMEKWRKALKPFLTGKTSINFSKYEELPEDTIIDIIKKGTNIFIEEATNYRDN